MCCDDAGCLKEGVCERGEYGLFMCQNSAFCGESELNLPNNSRLDLSLEDIPLDEICVFHMSMTMNRTQLNIDLDIATLYSAYNATLAVYVREESWSNDMKYD